MDINTFKSICTSLNWDKLISFLSSSVEDLSYKIFVSALIETNHPDINVQKKYALYECWGDKLSNIFLRPAAVLFTNRVTIYDFYNAYCISSILLEDSNIDPKPIQNIIYDYVVNNKINLTGVFDDIHQKMDNDVHTIEAFNRLNNKVQNVFGNLNISEHDIEIFNQMVINAESIIETTNMKNTELRQEIASLIDLLFHLKPGTCSVLPENLQLNPYTKSDDKLFKLAKGSHIIWKANHINESNSAIRFGDKIHYNEVYEYCEQLCKLGLDVNYVNFKNVLYIQLFSTLDDTIAALKQI
jgi:hypothetical protein